MTAHASLASSPTACGRTRLRARACSATNAALLGAALLLTLPAPGLQAAGSNVDGDMATHAGADEPLAATSENGLYTAAVTPIEGPIPLNRIHTWNVHLATEDGVAVDGATITVSGGMPMHDHGLPTSPRLTAELGEGNYRLEGMKFQMPGHWVIELRVEASAGTDTVMLELML